MNISKIQVEKKRNLSSTLHCELHTIIFAYHMHLAQASLRCAEPGTMVARVSDWFLRSVE